MNTDWTVFTQDEKEGIEKLLDMRMPEHITASIINMTGAKEIEIAKILAQTNPLTDLNENVLRESIITEYYKIHTKGPQTPEEELELQKQLDSEITKFHKEQQDKANALQESLKPIIKEDLPQAKK